MNERAYVSALPHPPAAAFAWHARPGALPRLIPPWTRTEVERFDGLHDGATTVLRVDAGLPVRPRWEARHEGYVEGQRFEDVQVEGPFKTWHHVHRFDAAAGGTAYVDDIVYDAPFGAVGDAVAEALLGGLDAEFAYRHRTVRDDLALHARYGLPPLTVALTGASGLIGTALRHVLTTGGHRVLRLVRGRAHGDDEVAWDLEAGTIEADKLKGVDAVVHLAGESVFAPRWTDAKKARILDSRVRGTDLLARTLARLERKPAVLLSGSAIGIYGDRGDAALPETAAPASSDWFLADVVRQWEAATAPAEDAGIRTVHLRTGVVLSPRGGALAQMLPAFRLGLGGPLGNPDAYLPWIGIDDQLGAIVHALATDALRGPVNLAAPEPTTMRLLARTLADVLERPAALAVPAFLLKTLGGQAAHEMLLASARVVPEKLLDTGYAFRHADLETALRHLLGRARDGAAFPDV